MKQRKLELDTTVCYGDYHEKYSTNKLTKYTSIVDLCGISRQNLT